MASYQASGGTIRAVKNSVIAGVLGVVFTPMMQSMLTEANVTGVAGTILGYVPLLVAAGIIIKQFEGF